jgi:hypothetical protein
MKSLRFAVPLVLLALSAGALAQSDAQKSFDAIKTLAGTWEGHATLDPPDTGMDTGSSTQVSMRVTSRGNAIVHEMGDFGKMNEDPTKHDHPVTMLYLDEGRLLLTHYCDAGNRPRMAAKMSPDGKTIDFDFLDVAGPTQYGHMQHAKFTIIDANHHVEEWTFLMPGDKPMRGRIDLQRTK